jgi:uracil-DNA glycosylase family 4
MNIKNELCAGCCLFDCRGPIESELNDSAEVLFVGEAPGAVEIEKGRPMVGEAGRRLRTTLEYLGKACPSLTRFAIANVFRCRPPGNVLEEDAVPGEYCKRALLRDLTLDYKVIVPLGSTALTAVCPEMEGVNITTIQGKLFTSNGRFILPMFHPSYINRRGSEWRSWELGFDKLVMFLNTGKTHYISPENRVVHQAVDSADVLRLLKMVRERSLEYKRMDCDIETTPGLDPWSGEVIPDVGVSMPWADSRIISISIAWKPDEAIAFMRAELNDESMAILKNLLEDESISWGWYNGQFDIQHILALGIKARLDRDGQLAMHEVDERNGIHALKKDSAYFLDAEEWETEVKKYAPTKSDSYEKIPRDLLLRYNGLDSSYTNQLEGVAEEYMRQEGSLWHYQNILCPAYNALARARYKGLRVDMFRVQQLQDKILPVMEDLSKQMCELTGNSFFNPNSPAQKKEALHKRGIMVESTAKDILEQYEGDELVDLITAYMQAAKMESTYLRGFVDDVFKDLRVHPNWKLPAENGRMRAENPPVLTMPRKAEIEEHRWKRYIKEIFVSDPGTLFLQLDRKQSEVRCVVFLAKDVEFIKHLRNDPRSDIHGEFTKMLYGAGYTKEQRVWVKMIVFGLIYNREAPSLARQLTAISRSEAKKRFEKEGKDFHTAVSGVDYKEWPVRDAQKFIDAFFEKMPPVKIWKKEDIALGMKQGFLVDYFGLYRRWGIINRETRHHAENEMVNFPPSCLSNDINLATCAETMRQFGKYGVDFLLPVHDSGMFQIPKDSTSLKDEIQGLWESYPSRLLRQSPYYNDSFDCDIPMPVDVGVADRWSDL